MTIKLLLGVGDDEEEIYSYTDQSSVQIKYLRIFNYGNTQLRKLRNPDALTETCINNVGSFLCSDISDERMAIGWGGSGAKNKYISVVRADGTLCVDHPIPLYGSRAAPAIGYIGKWLMLCGGGSNTNCMKLDLDSDSPYWMQVT